MMSPDKALTPEERELAMKDLQELHDIFVNEVSTSRGVPVEQIRALADGSSLNGTRALEHQLIDDLGGSEGAIAYLEQLLGEPVAICWR